MFLFTADFQSTEGLGGFRVFCLWLPSGTQDKWPCSVNYWLCAAGGDTGSRTPNVLWSPRQTEEKFQLPELSIGKGLEFSIKIFLWRFLTCINFQKKVHSLSKAVSLQRVVCSLKGSFNTDVCHLSLTSFLRRHTVKKPLGSTSYNSSITLKTSPERQGRGPLRMYSPPPLPLF